MTFITPPDEETLLLDIEREPIVEVEGFIDGWSVAAALVGRQLGAVGPGTARRLAEWCDKVVNDPAAIFRDLSRHGFERALCYVGKSPEQEDYDLPYVMLFFGRHDRELNEIVIFDWTDRIADARNPNLPAGWINDFGERPWQRPASGGR